MIYEILEEIWLSFGDMIVRIVTIIRRRNKKVVMNSMWLCPKGHEMTLWRGQFPYRKMECEICKNKGDDFGIYYEGCDLILNRDYTIDEILLDLIMSDIKNAIGMKFFVDKPYSRWQPRYLGNVHIEHSQIASNLSVGIRR